MAELYSYKTDFEPMVLIGETAQLIKVDETLNMRCTGLTALPYYIKDFGSINASTTSSAQQDTNLEMGKREMAQFRMMVLDDIQVKLYIPSSVKLWRTSRQDFWLPQTENDTPEYLAKMWFKMSEFFVYETTIPSFDLVTNVGPTRGSSRVVFTGYRYQFALLPAGQFGKTIIRLNAWPAGSTA